MSDKNVYGAKGDFGPGWLLIVQRVDGVEQGRLIGGIETEEKPDES